MFIRNLFRDEIIDQQFLEAVDLFNANNQAESYQMLFDLWIHTKSPNRKLFFQALLQSSAALQLLDKRKFTGAKKVYSCALKKLINYSTLTKPFDIRQFIFDMIDYFENYNCDFQLNEIDVQQHRRPRLFGTALRQYIRV